MSRNSPGKWSNVRQIYQPKMATRMPLMPPENETEAHFSRITREGKRISYKLSVMQQPERARACGAGAKCMPLLFG